MMSDRVEGAAGPPKETARSGDRRKAVVYVSSAGFAYATLVSALQVETQIDPDREDLLIFLINVDEPTTELVRSACAGKRVQVRALDASLFALPPGVSLAPGHVPAESLGRLVLHQVLDPAYDRVLYLDGDTLILGDIRPLLDHEPAPGTIGAVRDLAWLTKVHDPASIRQMWERYTSELGLHVPDDYFNAGVLSLRRDDLQTFSEAALRYVMEHPARCRFLDQSALNSVCNGRLAELWPGFNYHMPYQELVPVKAAKPSVVHFTGPVKPWVFRGGRLAAFAEVYDRFDADHSALAVLRREAPPGEQKGTSRWLMRRAIRQRLRFWSWFPKRRSLRAYLQEFVLAQGRGCADTSGLVGKGQLATARRPVGRPDVSSQGGATDQPRQM